MPLVCRTTAALLLLAAFACDVNVLTEAPRSNPYRTEHFVIYYNDAVLDNATVEEIALRKESILEHINAYLETSYDGVMQVFIDDTVWTSHATGIERVYEQTGYVLFDNGHEIVHIVVDQQWGSSFQWFIVEGLAVAASLPAGGSGAFEAYKREVQRQIVGRYAVSIDTLMNGLKQDITVDNAINYAHYSLAGGFIDYLENRFGIASVKEWYRLTADRWECDGNEEAFRQSFGVDLQTVIDDFAAALLEGA